MAPEKTDGPASCLTFLGIQIDTVTGTLLSRVGILHWGTAVWSTHHSPWEIICEEDDQIVESSKASFSPRSFECALLHRPLVLEAASLEWGGPLPLAS